MKVLLEKASNAVVVSMVISFILYKGEIISLEITTFITAWAIRIYVLELLVAGVSYGRKYMKLETQE